MSHFAAIGIPVADAAEVQGVLAHAFDRARDAGEIVEHESGLTARYADPSGATLSIHTNRKRQFECCQPGFDGGSRFSWQPSGTVADGDGCGFCDLVYAELLDEEGDPYYPFALTLENMGEARGRIAFEEPGEVTFAALCEEARSGPTRRRSSGRRRRSGKPTTCLRTCRRSRASQRSHSSRPGPSGTR